MRARSKPPLTSGPVPIEAQKQVPDGHGAFDGHDERLAAPISVVLVDEGTAAEHVVVDGQCGDVAGAHAQEGHRRGVVLEIDVGELIAVARAGRWAREAGR